MGMYEKFAEAVRLAGVEIFWHGATPADEVDNLEVLLGYQLPESFRAFLIEYGGGGPMGAEVSGIESSTASSANGGTVYGDTQECMRRYGLPKGLPVIFFHDDEVCWCLDILEMKNRECPVVAYDLFGQQKDRVIAENFHTFLTEHLSLYSLSK